MACYIYNRPMEYIFQYLERKFGKKKPEMIEPNKKVLKDGYNYAANIQAIPNTYNIEPAHQPKGLYRNTQHRAALQCAFGGKPIRGFDNMIEALIRGYASIGFERKRSIAIQLLQYLQDELRLIVKLGKCYYFGNVPDERGLFADEE